MKEGVNEGKDKQERKELGKEGRKVSMQNEMGKV